MCGALLLAGAACGDSQGAGPAASLETAGSSSAGSAGSGPVSGRGGGAGTAHIEPPPSSEAGAGGAACEREVSLAAVTLGEPQPFDLVIIADHSGSLSWSRDELARGLAELLVNVEGRDVRVFLLTPTQYGASSEAAVKPLTTQYVVAWQDPVTGEPYQGAMTEFEQTCTDPEGVPIDCPNPLGPEPYEVEGTFRFVMPDPIAHVTPDLTAAEFEAEQLKVAEAILAIGGTGSPEEMPLCTLGRYITQDASILPQNAVFLVISDEDDVSLPDDCLVGFRGSLEVSRREVASEACSSGCDAYRYLIDGDVYLKQFLFECAMFDDFGNPIPESEQRRQATQGTLASCDEFPIGACSAEEELLIGRLCESGAVLTACDRACSTQTVSCSVDLEDPAVDPCTGPFSVNSREYADLAAYCDHLSTNLRNCRGGGVNLEYVDSTTGGFSPLRLVNGSTSAELGSFFRARADQVFSPDGYLLEAIVFDEAFSCELGQGQSYANNLISVVADDSKVFPLCEAYAPALDGIWDFAQALVQTRFPLTLAEDEQVTSVIVVAKNGDERVLAASVYTYDAATGVLSVAESAISGTDASLRVEVTSDCRPVVR